VRWPLDAELAPDTEGARKASPTRAVYRLPNNALERPARSHSLAAAAHRERSAYLRQVLMERLTEP